MKNIHPAFIAAGCFLVAVCVLAAAHPMLVTPASVVEHAEKAPEMPEKVEFEAKEEKALLPVLRIDSMTPNMFALRLPPGDYEFAYMLPDGTMKTGILTIKENKEHSGLNRIIVAPPAAEPGLET